MKYKGNLSIKLLFLQNDENALTTLLAFNRVIVHIQ